MPTLTFKATEMKDAKVAVISLVDRAATRIPFKVIKQEKPMSVLKHLDLASVFKKEKAVVTPEIIGVITMKSEGFESVKAQIAEVGFSTDVPTEQEDGSVVFGQGAPMEGEFVLIRLSEDAVMAVKGYSPYNMNMTMGAEDGASFGEMCKAQGFYPGVGTMVDVLRSGVLQVAEKAEDPQAASVKVGKMFDEAKQYAMSMIGALPSKAFKLEHIFPEGPATVEKTEAELAAEAAAAEEVLKAAMSEAEKAHMATLTGKAKMEFMTMSSADRVKVMGVEEADPKDPADDAKTGEVDPKGKAKKAEVPPEDQSQVADAPAGLTQEVVVGLINSQMETLTVKMEAMMAGVAKSVESVGANVQALASRVDTAEGVAKAASEAVSGTVVLGSDGGDQTQVVAKNEGGYRGREIDTAYAPRPNSRVSSGRR